MRKIDVGVNLDDSEAKKKLQELTNKKHTANVNVNINGQNSIKNTVDEIDRLNKTVKNTGTVFGSIRNKLSDVFNTQRLGMGAFLTSVKAIHDATKNFVVTTNELDKSITDLSVAMNDTRSSATQYLVGLNKQAQELGVTTKTVADASDRWLRQNKSMKETTELVKDSVMLSTLGQIDSARATEYLTSAMNGYQKSVGEAVDIVSKLVEVDAKAAVDAGGLAEGMARTANVANTAGVSMDKLLSYLATTGEVTQRSMSSVGEAFKTIFTRMSDIKANKLTLADADGTEEILSDVELTLKNVGIDLKKTVTEYNSYADVLDSLAAKWGSLNQIQQNALSKAFAGTRQAEMFRALMENYGKSLEYVEVSLNSAGAAQEKFSRAYSESLEAKKNTLQAAFESLTINSDFDQVQGSIIEATTALVKFIDHTNALKGLATGVVTGLLIKGFLGIKTGISEAFIQLNQFNKALEISKQTQISTDSFERLNILSKNLSENQLKLVLSSKALTTEQRIQLLTTSGLSKEEALLKLQTMGLLNAETGLAAGTATLGNAFKGLFMSLAANLIPLIVMAISGAVMAFQSYKQSIEEARQKSLEEIETAGQESDEITELTNKYLSLSEEVKNNKASKEDLLSVQDEVIEKLELEGDSVEELTKKYGSLTNAIRQKSIEKLKENEDKLRVGVSTAKSEYDTGVNSSNRYGFDSNGKIAYAYNAAIAKKNNQKNIGMLSNSSDGRLNYLLNGKDAKEQLQILKEWREEITKLDKGSGTYSSELASLQKYIDDVQKKIDDYSKANEKLNKNLAEQKILTELSNKDIPKNKEEFESFKKTITDSALKSKDFSGSQKQVKAAIDNTLKSMPEFKQYYDDLADSINKATEASEKSANTSNDDAPVKFTKSSWEAFDIPDDKNFSKEKDELIQLAEQGSLTIDVFKDTPNSQNILDHFGLSAEQATEAINRLVDRADQLDSMKKSIKSLSDNLGAKKASPSQGIDVSTLAGMSDELKACTKEWKKYENVMGSANSKYADCVSATNELATAFVNSNNFLSNLDETSKGYYITQLKMMGVANAEEVVTSALANKISMLDAEKKWLKLTTDEVTRAMNGEIEQLAKEKGWSDETKNAIYRLTLQKMTFNRSLLDVSKDIDSLIELAKTAGVTAQYMANLNTIKLASTSATHTQGMPSDVAAKQAQKALDDFKEGLNNGDIFGDTKIKPPKIDISPVNSSSSNKNSGKNKSTKSKTKETKTAIDWIARSLKVLQDKIDLTKAKFDNLFGYNRKKNNLLKQIEQQKTLIEQTTRAVKAYQKEADKALKKVGSKTITISTKKVTKATVSSGNDLIATAKKQLGYKEYGNNGTKFGKAFGSQFAKWCQFFVSWVQKKSGLSSKQAYMGGSTSAGMQWYKNHKMFGYKGKYTPKANDTIYFKSAGRSHTGIVEKVKNGKVYTIEGNSGNKVKRRSYSLNDKTITGYGKTSKYFKGSTSSKTSTVKLSKEQINYIKQLVTNYNTSDKALIKSMLIKKYGEKQGEKINNYISAFDKLTDVKKELEEQTSALYKMESDLRDLKLEYNEKKRSYYEARYANVTTVTDKNKILDKEISVYNSDNKAQDDYLKNVRTAQAKVAKTSVKKIKTTKTNSKKGITKALKKKIYALIKQRKKIPSSILKQVKKASVDAYNDLVEYNNQLDRFKEAKLDVDTEKEKNTTNIREKKIEKQQNIQDEADANISKLEAQSEIARDEKGNATAKEKNKYLAEQVKWIKQSYDAQIQIAKLEGNLALVEELRAKKQKELLDNTIQQKQNLADEADAQINLYEAQADNVYTAKGKIELYEKELAPLKDQYDKLIEIAKLEGDATEAERLRVEYSEKVAENYKKQFDAISHELNNKNGLLDNVVDSFQSAIDLIEAKGNAISTDVYESMMAYTQRDLDNDKVAKVELEEKLENLEGDDWYAAMSDYANLLDRINDKEKSLWEWQQKINEIELKPFEKLADSLDFINEEFEFMLKVIQDGNELFNADTGTITDAGLATFAVYFDQMELAQEAIKNYKEELAKVEEQYQAGSMSLDDYTEKTEELTRKIWDENEAFLGIKDTIIDMVKEGREFDSRKIRKVPQSL